VSRACGGLSRTSEDCLPVADCIQPPGADRAARAYPSPLVPTPVKKRATPHTPAKGPSPDAPSEIPVADTPDVPGLGKVAIAPTRNLLDEALLSLTEHVDAPPTWHTLPGLLARLSQGVGDDFPSLRPHQRQAWHAFLVQLAALALSHGPDPIQSPPTDERSWHDLLLALTPGATGQSAWHLTAPADHAAFMQPPLPAGLAHTEAAAFKKRVVTPDSLDLLVAARNHDQKREFMWDARPEHWVYALVSLQTQECSGGSGNYGISRTASALSSRPSISVVPAGGVAARFRRDVRELIAQRGSLLAKYAQYPSVGGHALLWTLPWDGTEQLSVRALDIYYIEICRRVRLRADVTGRLEAYCGSSTRARIDAGALHGDMGDPWAPFVWSKKMEVWHPLIMRADGLPYHTLVRLLFPSPTNPLSVRRAPLQEISAADDLTGLHERAVPVSRTLRRLLTSTQSDLVAATASERVRDAAQFMSEVLKPSLIALLTGAAPSAGSGGGATPGRVVSANAQFSALVDATFFAALEDEIAVLGDKAAAAAVRSAWYRRLNGYGAAVLRDTLATLPGGNARHYRIEALATHTYESAFSTTFGARL
jgi:CRISPR system Cascade subunit CasA